MSATPIPRTLELTVYGDLDVSRIDEKPPGRTPVATRAAPMTRIAEVEARLREAVAGGAQAFWICPLVSESELHRPDGRRDPRRGAEADASAPASA